MTRSVAFVQVLRFYCNNVGGTDCFSGVAIMQLEVSAAFLQVTVSAANMLNMQLIFIVILQVRVSFANYAGGIFCSAFTSLFLLQLCR